LVTLVLTALTGCSAWDVWNVRSQSPDEALADLSQVRLVGDLAVPDGMYSVQVEAVGLVVGLRGTGSDPAPSPQRSYLIDEMRTRGVRDPNHVLASPNTAMVLVRGVLRRGIQEGDRFDVEVRIPSSSETTSLRGGKLLRTRLRQMAVLGSRIHEGHLLGLAEGPVLVDPAADGQGDRVMSGRGRVLGGAIALKSRSMGLVIKPGRQNVYNSSRIATALNKRFHTFEKGIKTGVATAKTHQYVELKVHARYKENVDRYMRLVRATALRETPTRRMERIDSLGQRLLDPVSAAGAALELEAIGKDGVDGLLEGIKSPDAEVRFYSAEALAYLDRSEAVAALGQAARSEPAFRLYALTALSAMDDLAACEELRSLLSVASAETRYGAFRSLWAMNPADPVVAGQRTAGGFSFHVLRTEGPPMIHATRNRRPEIVLFGQGQRFLTPLAVDAGNQIMVTSVPGKEEIAVSRFSVNEADQRRVVSTDVDAVIRAIVDLGGTYPDVVQAIQEAKAAGALQARFEIEALPEAGRAYDRTAGRTPSNEESPGAAPRDGGPLSERADSASAAPAAGEKSKPSGGFLARMVGRDPN